MKPLVLALLTAACAALPLNAQTKPLEIWVNGPSDARYYVNMIRMYQEKADPEFQANVRYFGFTEMPDKLAIAMRTGINPPDIVQLDEIFFSIYLGSPEVPFLDLSDRIRESGLERAILPQRLGLFRFGGKTYGVPQSVSATVFYYRDDLLHRAGLSPDDLTTWDDFVEAGRRIANSGTGLLAMDWSYFEILLRQRGYELFDASGKDQLDHPVALETLEWLVNLVREGVGIVPDRSTIFEPTFFTTDVINDEVIGVIGADWYGLDMIQHFSPRELHGQWRAMPLPLWTDVRSRNDRDTSSFSGQGLLIYRRTPQADRAWEFIRFVMEDIDANVERYLQGNALTAYQPAWADPRLRRPDPVFGGQVLGSLLMDVATRVPYVNQSPLRAAVINLLREKYWNSLVFGAISPREALQGIRRDLEGMAGTRGGQ